MHIFESFREAKGLNQTQLGVLLGIPEEKAQGRVSHYETGRRSIPVPMAKTFIKVAAEHGESYTLESVYAEPAKQEASSNAAA